MLITWIIAGLTIGILFFITMVYWLNKTRNTRGNILIFLLLIFVFWPFAIVYLITRNWK